VSFVKVKIQKQLRQIILDSLNLIQFDFPNNLENIVIKPNMCYYWDYSTGQTTDVKFVAALIELLREKITRDLNISIVESDASAMKCKHAFKILGYEKLSKECKVKLVNLTEDPYETVNVTAGGCSFKIMVPKTIQEADLRINVPKIKYSTGKIKITCALKNIFGCNPYPKKYRYHPVIDEAIVAINKAMRFHLHIIDANIVSGVQPKRLGLIMASQDPVALDTAASKIAGVNPKTIKYLQLAQKEGLGKMSFTTKGEPLEYFKAQYPQKSLQNILMGKAYTIAIQTGLNKKLGIE
jgi:uncharacterized protein (DUF362 family)